MRSCDHVACHALICLMCGLSCVVFHVRSAFSLVSLVSLPYE